MLVDEDLTRRIIGLAIEVHRNTGRGLLESVYQQCLCYELLQARIPFERQAEVPVFYKGLEMSYGFRADIMVDRKVIIEIKSVTAILPAHEAQVQTYLRMSRIPVGLLLNFNVPRLVDGLRRYVM